MSRNCKEKICGLKTRGNLSETKINASIIQNRNIC